MGTAVVLNTNNKKRQRRLLTTAALLQGVVSAATNNSRRCRHQQRFVRIIDGGSTGSRLHTFEYGGNDSIQTVGHSTHIDTPLSDYVEASPEALRNHLLPLFPKDTIPVIPCYYGATAGMRLVDESLQERTYERMFTLNDVQDFRHSNVLVDAFTLSGTDEAYYGALAANYIMPSTGTISGALDIGGASTQLVNPLSNDSMRAENFFSISLLGYGVDQFQKRLYREIPRETNPCLNQGYLNNERANATECRKWMLPLLTAVPDMIQTNLSTDREYIAMSLYFFSFDALRHFSGALQDSWPTPTLSQLQRAGEILCDKTWDELIESPSHAFTRNENDLSKRCFEAVYFVELLRAMGFTDDFTIRYMFQSESGDEVEWTLGMALALRDSITNECIEDDDPIQNDDSTRENRTHNNGTTNATWAQRLSMVLSADDIFAR